MTIIRFRDPRTILRYALSERVGANPGYSLRAFARDLKLSPQQLSNVINGRKGLSPDTARRVAQRLSLSSAETDYFCQLVQSQFGRSKAARAVAAVKLRSLSAREEQTRDLTLDAFRVVSDWYHFALLELVRITPKKSHRVSVFSKRLGVAASEVKLALERLERLNLIVRKEGDTWAPVQETVFSPDGIPSEAIRKFHTQVLQIAMQAVTTQSIKERILSTSFLTVQPSEIPRAERLIRKFREKFVQQLSQDPGKSGEPGEAGEEVYSLGVQFIRLSKPQLAKPQLAKPQSGEPK